MDPYKADAETALSLTSLAPRDCSLSLSLFTSRCGSLGLCLVPRGL
ncbi:hypothetical protein RchiOBHm_Chr1g0320351 [Rosa chinensis]|uniref:Uncharacterized protein n=1 Tax=Rosa chinensis TaxID=74649 RepID=A0A2P6S8N1_ROSCH|nr:hypothetical protein RchiOBHm_Chr1g0320351 [Rosa chinensis]